jgi:hypothetical protein
MPYLGTTEAMTAHLTDTNVITTVCQYIWCAAWAAGIGGNTIQFVTEPDTFVHSFRVNIADCGNRCTGQQIHTKSRRTIAQARNG